MPPLPSKQSGFTLSETLTAVLISGILFTAGAPAFDHGIEVFRARSAGQHIFHAVQHARTLAIQQPVGNTITLCGSEDGLRCNRNWGRGWILFADRNGNRRLDAGETLHQHNTQHLEGSLNWSASAGRPYLRFTREGYAMEFGAVTYCPNDLDPRYARQITVNRPGRARLSRDRDGDGIHEDSYGKPLSCGS